MFLADIPLGTVIHNIELKPGKGGAIARGAGTYAQLNARDGRYAIVKMPSGETRLILDYVLATIGLFLIQNTACQFLVKQVEQDG